MRDVRRSAGRLIGSRPITTRPRIEFRLEAVSSSCSDTSSNIPRGVAGFGGCQWLESSRDESNPITMLVLEEADGGIGLKIPEFDIEIYGEDLPELIEQAEEQLWWKLERSGEAIPETATLAISG